MVSGVMSAREDEAYGRGIGGGRRWGEWWRGNVGEWTGVHASQESGAVGNSSISVQVSFGVGSSTTYSVAVRVAGSGMG